CISRSALRVSCAIGPCHEETAKQRASRSPECGLEIMTLFRFRRFSLRLLALLLGLLFAALAVTYLFVSRANNSNALAHSEANLEVGAGIFAETIRQRIAYLA